MQPECVMRTLLTRQWNVIPLRFCFRAFLHTCPKVPLSKVKFHFLSCNNWCTKSHLETLSWVFIYSLHVSLFFGGGGGTSLSRMCYHVDTFTIEVETWDLDISVKPKLHFRDPLLFNNETWYSIRNRQCPVFEWGFIDSATIIIEKKSTPKRIVVRIML